MRTKSVLLAALCGLVGASAVEAQSVYSVNAVGYVNIVFTNGTYTMFSNPLNTTNNTVGTLIPTAPAGSKVYAWNGTSFKIATYVAFLSAWDHPEYTLDPGKGAFMYAAGTFTNTFVGEVLQGSLTNTVASGYTIVSSQIPISGTFDTLGFTPLASNGDKAYVFNTGKGQYDIYTMFFSAWNPSAIPTIPVGGSFFILSTTGGSVVRTFSVN